MKRLGLVLFVCLCLQVSGVSMPFVHLHADADHDTTHHDGRVAHSHLAAHQVAAHPDDHHHAGSNTVHIVGADDAASIEVAGESIVGVGSPVARLPQPPLTLSPPEVQFLLARPPGRVVELADDVGGGVPRSPDLSSPSLRGPPR